MKNDYLQSDTVWIVISDPLIAMIRIRHSLSFQPNRRPSIIQVLTYLSKMKVLAELFSSAQLFSGNSISKLNKLLPPANEVCEGYVFTRVCHSVHKGGGVVSQHALQWYHSMPCSRSPGEGGGGYLSMPCRSLGWVSWPTPRGGVEGSGQRGVSRPTPRRVSRATLGGSQHAQRQTPPPPWTATAVGGMHPTGMHSCFKLP